MGTVGLEKGSLCKDLASAEGTELLAQWKRQYGGCKGRLLAEDTTELPKIYKLPRTTLPLPSPGNISTPAQPFEEMKN